jgi:hypothetical protein
MSQRFPCATRSSVWNLFDFDREINFASTFVHADVSFDALATNYREARYLLVLLHRDRRCNTDQISGFAAAQARHFEKERRDV